MDNANIKKHKVKLLMTKACCLHLINSCHGSFIALDRGTGRTSPPVYCSVQLPWQPAPSPLSGDESEQRDCREHVPLLLHSHVSLLPPHFRLLPLLSPIPFFSILICDPWSAWQWVLPRSGAVMSIPSAVTMPVTALLAEAERDRSGTSRLSVLVTYEDRVEESAQLWHVYLLFAKIRLISNVHHSLNDRDRWKWRLNGW